MAIQKINHYEIVEKLGSGGMGEVYRAFDRVLERDVAIKIMHKHLLDIKKHNDRFLVEARAAAKLVHPNVVAIYEIGHADCGRYIVMEYVNGRSLSDLINSEEKIPPQDVLKIMQQILHGIAAAHKMNIFHRDIKPDNILVFEGNNAKILDFGIAKIESNQSLTLAGDILGTIEYMAPEQMLGDFVDYRCDLYAAGIVFYQMLTGRLPFSGDATVDVLFKKLNEDPIPPSYFNDKLPAGLEQVVLKALHKEKSDRWSSAQEFINGINSCFKKDPISGNENVQIFTEFEHQNKLENVSADSSTLRSVFIGRDTEFRKLAGLYRRAAHNKGQTIIIGGETGVGKSSLADQLKQYVQREDVFVLLGECLYQEGLDAYLPYIDALRKFIDKDSHRLAVKDRENLKASIRDKVPLLTEFNESFNTIFPNHNQKDTQEPNISTGNLSEGIYYILSQLTNLQPVILVIDDLHWADEASLRLFHYLSRNISHLRLLLIGITRTDKYDLQQNGKPNMIVDMLSRMRQEGQSLQIDLKRLKRDDCDLMIDEVLSKTLLSEDFYDNIRLETKGNPFFIIETLKLAQETGAIIFEDGAWRDKPEGFKLEIPHRVEDVLVRRLNGLSEEERESLQIAAVLGYKFDVSLLATVLEKSKIKLIKTLHRIARDLEILTGTETGFQFEHPMLKDLLYAEIPTVLAREYHLLAAKELENINKNNLGILIGEVAQHYRRGKNFQKAIPLLYKAASKAFKISAYKEASLYLEDLFDAVEKSKTGITASISPIDIYLKFGICYEELGRWDQSLEAYNKLLTISEEKKLPHHQIDALRRMGRVYDKLGNWELALQNYETCLKIVNKHPIKNILSRIYNNIGLIHFQKGHFDQALQYFENTLDSVDSEMGEFDRAHALTNMGTVYNIQGNHKAALESYLKALEIYKKQKYNQKNIARVYHNIGMTQSDLENWSDSIEAFEKCFSLADDVEDKQLIALTYLNMGKAFARQGELKKAKTYVSKALKIFKRLKDILSIAEAYNVYGIIYGEKNEFIRSEKYFKESIKINEQKKYYEGIADNYVCYGNLNRDFGKTEQAKVCYEKAIHAYKKMDLADKVREVSDQIQKLVVTKESEINRSIEKFELEVDMENYDFSTKIT